MIVKHFVTAALLSIASISPALELTIGKGNFDYSVSLMDFLKTDITLDIDLLSLKEDHLPLYKGFYLFGTADLYRSSAVDKYMSYLNQAASFDPFGVSGKDIASKTGIPVPVNFKVRGFDLLVGIGYDLYRSPNGSNVGIGVATGISMPVIETKKPLDDAKTTLDILKETKTKIVSYKIMPSLQGSLQLTPWLAAGGMVAYGIQYGSLENDYLNSSAHFNGSVLQSDLHVQTTPLSKEHWYKNVSLSVGYRYNDWDVNRMNITLTDGLVSHDYSREMDMGFASDYWYFGAGWRF